MARSTTMAPNDSLADQPTVRTIGVRDLQKALWRGLDDFQAKPSHLIFLGIIYPVVALILSRLTFGYQVLPLLFPLAAGFALIGPFAAIGLYELSRRREQGLEIGVRHAFGVLKSPSIGSILALGGLLAVVFLIWLGVATWLYRVTLGEFPGSFSQFFGELFTTSGGWTLIVVGNAIGFLFALLVLMIAAISFPMLVDRNVGAIVATQTSIRVFFHNPRTMVIWGLIVAVSLVLGSLPFFVGLAIIVPILGHATWHLYRLAVER